MDTTFLEALETTEKGAKRFKIRVISAGVSKNGNYYSPAALREAAPLFDGVRVLVRSDEDHIQGKGKDFRNLIGRLANPRFIESTAEIQADFELIEPNGAIAVKLREAFDGGMTGLFGFSIDAAALAKPVRINGQTVREACKITQVKSVDLIVEPGANGGIIDFIEAVNEEGQTMREKETKEETNVQEAAPAITAQEIDDKIRMVEARANAKATIAASSLPEMAKTRLKKHFETLADFKEADVETAIKDELDYLAKFTEANVKDLGAGRTAVTKDRLETVSERLDAFFDEGHKDHRQALSFKEAYVDLTGDAKVSGRIENFTEALTSTSFSNVLGDAITRRLVKEYNNKTQLDAWRKFASIVPVSDFREQKRVRMGGYGDLAAVSEAAAYADVTSPTDDVAKYSASKRGGLEKITLEMIKNDDVGAIRQIPVKLARAAKRTLSKFAFNLIVSNPTLGDSKTLFHADHGNLGSDALSAASFTARRLAMMKQKEAGSNEVLSIPPAYLLVPPELEETAYNLFVRNTNNDPQYVQTVKPEIIPIWYATDADDWYLAADPADITGIEIGFLDGNEEPELFVQDNPTSGSVFTNDQITYKIRHIYGGAVIDYRAFQGSVVTQG
nr:MAG TPA: Major capsid protein [Caudoviricetes sp.]